MFSNSPRSIKGGIDVMNRQGVTRRLVTFQYNPESLSRSFQAQFAESEGDGDRSQATRLTGPAIESIKLEAVLDATDQLEQPSQNPTAVNHGIQPQLAALEMVLYPTVEDLNRNLSRARGGAIEVSPVEAPLTIFVWSMSRKPPVRITELSIEEEYFDQKLNPVRARINLGMRVLTSDDFGYSHPGRDVYIAYQQKKEELAGLYRDQVGLGGLGR